MSSASESVRGDPAGSGAQPGPAQAALASAAEDVERTIDAARDSVERQIIRYRIGLVGALALASSSAWLATRDDRIFFGMIWASSALPYAFGAWLWTALKGRCRPVAITTAFVDLILASLPMALIVHLAPDRGFLFPWTVPAVLAAALTVNVVRLDERLSIAATLAACALFLASAFLSHQLPLQVVTTATCLCAVGALGVINARRTRGVVARAARLQLLQRYLPESARERVIDENPDAALAMGEQEAVLTILATDLRGFTSMSEKLEPAEVVRQLNGYHAAMLEVAERHGGELDKFIGDGQLFVFGRAGSRSDNGAPAAVACAREMLAELERHNAERAAAGLPPLKMGIGVHTGRVVSGNIGVRARRVEFTVIGDAVNTASRLESATKELSVPALFSAETVSLLPDAGGLVEVAPIALKGKVAPVRAFRLAPP